MVSEQESAGFAALRHPYFFRLSENAAVLERPGDLNG
jgi:hypothetical protein